MHDESSRPKTSNHRGCMMRASGPRSPTTRVHDGSSRPSFFTVAPHCNTFSNRIAAAPCFRTHASVCTSVLVASGGLLQDGHQQPTSFRIHGCRAGFSQDLQGTGAPEPNMAAETQFRLGECRAEWRLQAHEPPTTWVQDGTCRPKTSTHPPTHPLTPPHPQTSGRD